MKLSKYVKLVKNEGYCNVVHVAGSGIWLGTRSAIFRATELPDLEGEDQVRTVLDMTEKAWEKVYMKENYAESVKDRLSAECWAEREKSQAPALVCWVVFGGRLRAALEACFPARCPSWA